VNDYYEDEAETTEAVAVDDRIELLRQFVDMEAKAKHLDREQKRLAEQGHKLHAAMRDVHERLGTMLGFDSRRDDAKQLKAEVEKMRAAR
jgi:hypothetical protein